MEDGKAWGTGCRIVPSQREWYNCFFDLRGGASGRLKCLELRLQDHTKSVSGGAIVSSIFEENVWKTKKLGIEGSVFYQVRRRWCKCFSDIWKTKKLGEEAEILHQVRRGWHFFDLGGETCTSSSKPGGVPKFGARFPIRLGKFNYCA